MAAAGAISSPSVPPPAPEVQREMIAEAMKLEMKQGQVCPCSRRSSSGDALTEPERIPSLRHHWEPDSATLRPFFLVQHMNIYLCS